MIAWVVTTIAPYLAWAAAGIAAFAGIWFKAKAEGRKAERVKQLETQRKAAAERKEVDDEVHGMGDPALRKQLDGWVRRE